MLSFKPCTFNDWRIFAMVQIRVIGHHARARLSLKIGLRLPGVYEQTRNIP